MPNSRRVSRRQWWGVIIYGLVATAVIVGLVVWNSALYRNAVKSCQQQNVARVAANSGTTSLRTFLGIAISLSRQRMKGPDAKNPARVELDKQSIALYSSVRRHQIVVPIIDCKSINHQPWTFS